MVLQNKINLRKLVHLVGFTIEIYYDAWPYERHICVLRISAICKHLVHGQQEDAHEFMRYLLESMEKAYLARFKDSKYVFCVTY